MLHNADVDWSRFDSATYYESNYRRLGTQDRKILEVLRDFFVGLGLPRRCLDVIDVGAGTNLYPTLAVLPWARSITLLDPCPSNRAWLEREIKTLGAGWQAFWAVLSERSIYAGIDPESKLQELARVDEGDVLQLEEGICDVALMFFVAESITEDRQELETAVQHFLRSVRPSGSFAAAFMEGSTGYSVGSTEFPAVPLKVGEISEMFGEEDCTVLRVDAVTDPVRDGYSGMLLATGTVRG